MYSSSNSSDALLSIPNFDDMLLYLSFEFKCIQYFIDSGVFPLEIICETCL